MPPSGSTQLNRAIALGALLCAVLLSGCCTRPAAVLRRPPLTGTWPTGSLSVEIRPAADMPPVDLAGTPQEGDLVDFAVRLTNTGDRPLSLYDEWNSWGYFNLKLVFIADDTYEWWITKKGIGWTRNFPTWTTLAPGESTWIPVYLSPPSWPDTWLGLAAMKENAYQISTVRAVYEQHPEDADAEDLLFGDRPDPTLWSGMISSPRVSAAELLPGSGFMPRRPPEPLKKMEKGRSLDSQALPEGGLIIE